MANLISQSNFKALANNVRLIEEIGEITVHEFLTGRLRDYFTLIPGIKGGQPIAVSPPGGYITKRSKLTPKPTFTKYTAGAILQNWNPVLQEVRLEISWADFMSDFTQWLLGNGLDTVNLQGTTILQFLISKIQEQMEQDAIRIALFGKENIAATGILTDNDNAENYDQIESGLVETMKTWKKGGAAYDYLAPNFDTIDKNVKKTANEGPGLRHQYEGLTNTFTKDLLNKLTTIVGGLKYRPDTIYTNWSLIKNWTDWQEDNVNLESSKQQVISGQRTLTYRGINIMEIQQYENWRTADFAKDQRTTAQVNGNTPKRNHVDTANFAIYCRKQDLQLGIDAESGLRDLRVVFLDGPDENIYIKANYFLDFRFATPLPNAFRAAL